MVEGTVGGGSSLLTAIEARLRFLDSEASLPVQENIVLERPLLKGDTKQLPALIVEQAAGAMTAAGNGILAKEQLRRAPDAEVISALSGSDQDTTAWALAVAGERRLTEAVEAAIASLESESEQVRDAAFGALVAIRSERAIDALAKQVDFRDYDQVRTTIEAVSAIGGADATEFLEFVASGHPDPGIRERASEALKRITSAQPRPGDSQ